MKQNEALVNRNDRTDTNLEHLRAKAVEVFEDVKALELPFPLNFQKMMSLSDEVKRFECYLIECALEETNGNQMRAATLLNLNYSTLNAKIKRYDINEESVKIGRAFPNNSNLIGFGYAHPEDDYNNKHNFKDTGRSFRETLRRVKEVVLGLIEEIESLGFAKTIGTYEDINLPEEMQKFELHLIRSALDRSGGNQTRAAKILGIKLTTLNNKIKRYDIPIRISFESQKPKPFSLVS